MKYIKILVIVGLLTAVGFGAKAFADQKLNPTVVSCMQDAVEKRDSSIIVSMATFSTSMTDMLTTRKDAIKASWTLETKEVRDSARKVAWDNYKTSAVNAKQVLKTSRAKSWDQFRTDRKACGVSVTDTSTIDATL